MSPADTVFDHFEAMAQTLRDDRAVVEAQISETKGKLDALREQRKLIDEVLDRIDPGEKEKRKASKIRLRPSGNTPRPSSLDAIRSVIQQHFPETKFGGGDISNIFESDSWTGDKVSLDTVYRGLLALHELGELRLVAGSLNGQSGGTGLKYLWLGQSTNDKT